MKKIKTILVPILFSIAISSFSSCLVVHRTDNGNHRGWYKNSNNPHNPNSTNPGNGSSNGNGHGHGKKK